MPAPFRHLGVHTKEQKYRHLASLVIQRPPKISRRQGCGHEFGCGVDTWPAQKRYLCLLARKRHAKEELVGEWCLLEKNGVWFYTSYSYLLGGVN